MERISDKQLLQLCQSPISRERGFRLLLTYYQEQLYWHIRRLVIEHQDANDVLQNCCVKVYRNIEQFRGQSKLYTWLYRIATNEAMTFLKRQQSRRTESVDDTQFNLTNRLHADHYFDGDAAQLRLQEALIKLPEKQRLVFQMRYFDALSYQDISEVLGTSVGALKASYHHAVKKIEQQLKTATI